MQPELYRNGAYIAEVDVEQLDAHMGGPDWHLQQGVRKQK
jgi:hypothetical protein